MLQVCTLSFDCLGPPTQDILFSSSLFLFAELTNSPPVCHCVSCHCVCFMKGMPSPHTSSNLRTHFCLPSGQTALPSGWIKVHPVSVCCKNPVTNPQIYISSMLYTEHSSILLRLVRLQPPPRPTQMAWPPSEQPGGWLNWQCQMLLSSLPTFV